MGLMVDVGRKVLDRGGWAPLAVCTIHVVASRVLDLYSIWPQADIPMHFGGGRDMAYFLSRSFRAVASPALDTW
jgi:hypothetical protein